MSFRTSLSLLLASLSAMSAAPAASAAGLNTWDLISRSIPASACTPRDSAGLAAVEMVQGGWRFRSGSVGSVVLSCPLPITVFPADQAQGFASTKMAFYRVWYRDSDGLTASAGVLVTPYLRRSNGSWLNIGLANGGGGIVPPGVCQFSSNAFADIGFAVHTKDCVHAIEQNALYTFEVTMRRDTPSQTVEFHGIDFDSGARPEG